MSAPFAFRASPEDFVVEELPAQGAEPDPEGTHVWFTLEKRGVSTPEAARRVARALGRDARDVAFAGRKDAVAVTTQRMSIEHVDPGALETLELHGISVSEPVRHARKLRLGQLAGNRFRLRLSALGARVGKTAVRRALEEIERTGVPNRYGEQRFGRDGRGHEIGRTMVRGTAEKYLRAVAEAAPEDTREAARELVRRAVSGTKGDKRRARELAPELDPDLRAVAEELSRRRHDDPIRLLRALPKRTRAFHLSMFQAHVFNRVLEGRLRRGDHGEALLGDVVEFEGRHRVLRAFEELPEQGAAVPTGPIWSASMLCAEGVPGGLERAALGETSVSPEDLREPAGLRPRGGRRPLIVPLSNGFVESSGDETALWIGFDLPAGAFATVVLDALAAAVTG